jgi:hypothetical protein
MPNGVEIENIEAMRRLEGIEDAELREEIRHLAVGDFVKLTFLLGPPARGETLLVRITDIKGCNFCGLLAGKPSGAGLSKLLLGEPVAFRAAQIHSLPKSSAK